MSLKILVTCPPMLGMLHEFIDAASVNGLDLFPTKVLQVLSEHELKQLLPDFDGWIIGDDPATRQVFEAGKNGKLKAVVKWGVGVDNVDLSACSELNIPFANTPQMFGAEVADVALAYVIGLARQLFFIDREIHHHATWPKPAGVSLSGKKIGVVGYGDIGRCLTKRLLACDMDVTIYDPNVMSDMQHETWPNKVNEMDFLVFVCSLNEKNHHMLNESVLKRCKCGVRIVNVARGALIDENALIHALQTGVIHSVALDVFETEPLLIHSPLRAIPNCVFGSHNASNTEDAVRRVSTAAIKKLQDFLVLST